MFRKIFGYVCDKWQDIFRISFSWSNLYDFSAQVALDNSYLNCSLSSTHQVPILFFFFLTDFWWSYTCERQSHYSWFVIWPKISGNSQPTWWDRSYLAWHKWNIQILHKGMNPLVFYWLTCKSLVLISISSFAKYTWVNAYQSKFFFLVRR